MSFGRVRLYHHTSVKGKVFDNEADYAAHVNDGWVDFPTKINYPSEVVVAPGPVDDLKPEKPIIMPKVKARKPGRPSKKVTGEK